MQNLADIDLKDVTVAAYHEYPANTVPTNAFYIGDNNPKLQSIVLPDNITAIGTNAFMRSIGLKSLPVIPGGVKDIGLSAFRGCTGLRGTITLGSGVSKTGAYAFFNCLGCTGALVIPSGVTEIGDGAFQYCRGISHIVVNNPTPIPYTAEILPLYKEVLVPAASVEDYKALEEWKKHVINSL